MGARKIRALPEITGATNVILKPASWLANVEFVAHLILANNVLISILGEAVSGKTTFATLLQADLSARVKSRMITVSPLFDRAAFLQQLSALLDFNGEPSFPGFIAQSNENEAQVLLIIDDAHYLPINFIEEILTALKSQGSRGCFHVCLVSEFSIVPTLNKFSKNDFVDMIHSIELGVLSEAETKSYVIQNVLKSPGAENLITDERVKQFYQLTEGRLEKINQQMVDFFSYKPSKRSNHAKLFRQIGIVAGVFFAAVIGMVYMLMSEGTQQAPAQLVSIDPQSLVISQNEPVLSSDIPAYTAAAARQALQVTSVRRIGLPPSDEDDSAPNELLAVVDKVVVAPKIIQPQNKKVVAVIKKSVKVMPKQMTKAEVIKPVVAQSQFTIQLLASRNVAMLKQFAQAHHLDGKAKVRITQRQGTVWYVLTLGEYGQREQAKQAVNHLPKDIVQFNPWVWQIADLKAAG